MISKVTVFRNNHRRCSLKKAVLKNFAIITGKPLRQSLFLIKFQQLYLLKPSTPVFFCEYCKITPILKTSTKGCFCVFMIHFSKFAKFKAVSHGFLEFLNSINIQPQGNHTFTDDYDNNESHQIFFPTISYDVRNVMFFNKQKR